MKEIDCSYTDEIVCPHCGYEFSDSYEVFTIDALGYNDDFFKGLECEKCEKEFNVGRNISVSYDSYIPKENILPPRYDDLGYPV
jgi:DNA-directed RNA polymerase subunit RPC12/RpoP